MPAFNATRFLAEAIRAIQAQTYRDWLCVIVDDGSTDTTAQLAATLTMGDDRFTIVTQANGGVASARNLGLAHLADNVEWVSFPDSDDRWRPEALAALVAAAERGPGMIGAHGRADYVDEDGMPGDGWFATWSGARKMATPRGRIRPVTAGSPSTFATLIQGCTVYPPAVAITSKAVADAVGGFDVRVEPFEDWDWMIRAARHGSYATIDRVVLDYRQHDLNVSKQDSSAAYKRVRARARMSTENTTKQVTEARRAWTAHELAETTDYVRRTLSAARHHEVSGAGRLASRAGLHLVRALAGRPSRWGLDDVSSLDFGSVAAGQSRSN